MRQIYRQQVANILRDGFTFCWGIPEELVAIIRRIDVQSFADDRQEVHRKDVMANALA
jgi:hypothetical protein